VAAIAVVRYHEFVHRWRETGDLQDRDSVHRRGDSLREAREGKGCGSAAVDGVARARRVLGELDWDVPDEGCGGACVPNTSPS
jgi:hypothetical protein